MERYQRIFEDKETEHIELFDKAQFSASLWASTDKEFKHLIFEREFCCFIVLKVVMAFYVFYVFCFLSFRVSLILISLH